MLFSFFSILKNILDDSFSRPLIFLSRGKVLFLKFLFFLVEEFLILKTFNF